MLTKKLKDTKFYELFPIINKWFIEDYYSVFNKDINSTKTYELCFEIRKQLSNLLANPLVKKILCPTNEETGLRLFKDIDMMQGDYIDFDSILENGWVLSMSTAQNELKELSAYIGYFLTFAFKSAVVKRICNKESRNDTIFYMNDFQKYANVNFVENIACGFSSKVAYVLTTQTITGLASNSSAIEAKYLSDAISSNCKNKIVFPDCSSEDAEYFANEFNEVLREEQNISNPQAISSENILTDKAINIIKEENYEAQFAPDDIKLRPFGEAVFLTKKNNSIQKPQIVKLKSIDENTQNQCNMIIENKIKSRKTNNIDLEYLS